MQLSAETNHLLQKQLRQALQPAQVLGCAALTSLGFAAAYINNAFSGNADLAGPTQLAVLGLQAFVLLSAGVAVLRYRAHSPSRAWIAFAVCIFLGVFFGAQLGTKSWIKYGVNFYTWKTMASYINIDPASDRGQSYMDAGVVYFKESSRVQRHRALAFHNGLTYCVAPIVRQGSDGDVALPASGTIDFWAVGTDCCGRSGDDFRCGESESALARSGLRLLDETSRSMYLLAVQQWSAGSGLPVRHPLFFHWVRDPVEYQQQVYMKGWDEFVVPFLVCLPMSLAGVVAVHSLLQALRVS